MKTGFIALSPALVAGLLIAAKVVTTITAIPFQSAFSQTNTSNQLIIIPVGSAIEGAVQDYYKPETAQIPVGSQVTWRNEDVVAHTATAGTPAGGVTGQFDTGIIQPGGSATVTITTEGLIPYFCTLHPWMNATLQVSPSQVPAPQEQQQQQPLSQNTAATNATATNATGTTTGNQTAASKQNVTAATTGTNNTGGTTGG